MDCVWRNREVCMILYLVKESKDIGPYPIKPKILDPTMCMPPTL